MIRIIIDFYTTPLEKKKINNKKIKFSKFIIFFNQIIKNFCFK